MIKHKKNEVLILEHDRNPIMHEQQRRWLTAKNHGENELEFSQIMDVMLRLVSSKSSATAAADYGLPLVLVEKDGRLKMECRKHPHAMTVRTAIRTMKKTSQKKIQACHQVPLILNTAHAPVVADAWLKFLSRHGGQTTETGRRFLHLHTRCRL